MKNKTLNLLILNLIIAMLIWAAYFYIVHQVSATSATFDDIKHKIIFAVKKEQAVMILKKKVEDDFKAGFDLKDFLIRPDQTADVVQMIEGFGPITGTKIVTQSVSTQDAVGLPNGVDFLKGTFKIDGQKDNVLKSISLVENLPYNIKIQKLSFVKSLDASSTVKWSASVDILLVKLKDTDNGSTQQ